MPDAEFEKTFADLAHARLRDRAPGLLDYLVGFQLLDKSEDDTHAVGVWGFKVGSGWLYNPVFFLNGQLKGDELLYVKDQDAFVPMKEDWVNYLLNRRPHILGSPEERKLQELGVMQPDFNALSRPPYTGSKYASAGSVRSLVDYLSQTVQPEFRSFVPVILSSPGSEKRAELSERWNLPTFIKRAGKDAAKRLIRTMRKRASFADAVLKFYSMKELIKAAEDAVAKDEEEYPVDYPTTGTRVRVMTGDSKGKVGKITKVDETRYENEEKKDDGTEIRTTKTVKKVTVKLDSGGEFTTEDSAADLHRVHEKSASVKQAADGDTMIEGTAPTVQVMVADKANVNDLGSTMLTDAQKEQLQRDRYLVVDNRGPNDTAKVYATQISKTLQNPACSAYCNVLTQSGSFKPMLVIKAPVGKPRYCDEAGKDMATVVNPNGNRVRMVMSNDIFVDNEGHDQEGWEGFFNGLSDPSSITERSKIVLVNAKREGSAPFFVERKVTTADGQVRLYGDFDRYPITDTLSSMKDMLRPKFRGRVFNQSDSRAGRYGPIEVGGNTDTCLVITKKDGAQITQIGNDYFVPNGMKAIKISKEDIEPWKLRTNDYPGERKRTPDPDELANPQTIADIEMQLFKSGMVSRVQPISDGIEFWLRVNGAQSRPMSKVAALKELVERHAMTEKDATLVLKMAKRAGSPEYYVSKPQMRKAAQGNEVPMPEVPFFPEPQMGVDPQIGVPTIYPQEDEVAAGIGSQPRNEIDMDATFRAEQAAQQGQKEVMDTSVVGGLVKTMDPNAAIDGYIGDLMLGLDRVGRILFMYYWHYEKFKDRYGSQDMPELEDNLRNVFENLGDLTIFLKQKTVEPDVTDASAEAELSQVL
jgi:ribosomal protein L24